MADTPQISYEGAKRLKKYVKANGPKYGPSLTEPAGSGPGGAAATNRRVSSQAAVLTRNMPGYAGKAAAVIDDVNDLKLSRATKQAGEVRDIYNSAVDTLRRASGQRKKFKDI